MRDEYEKARKELGIPEQEFSLVAPHRHRTIALGIAERFTTLGKNSLNTTWWWEHLKGHPWPLHPEDSLEVVAGILKDGERYWLLAEEWMPPKKESPFWLYDATGSAILRILAETHFHEFYIVDKKLTWLLCENHHGVLAACGDLKAPAEI